MTNAERTKLIAEACAYARSKGKVVKSCDFMDRGPDGKEDPTCMCPMAAVVYKATDGDLFTYAFDYESREYFPRLLTGDEVVELAADELDCDKMWAWSFIDGFDGVEYGDEMRAADMAAVEVGRGMRAALDEVRA